MVLFVRRLWFSKRMASRNSTSSELVKQFMNRGHVVELTSESELRKGKRWKRTEAASASEKPTIHYRLPSEQRHVQHDCQIRNTLNSNGTLSTESYMIAHAKEKKPTKVIRTILESHFTFT
ncbi:hypothetical protein E5288_WYG008070 [Bos mutus]|uniref:Uncharacterized protein n=1 Tax=Bos mutus TaxID=72004 RepID=A0A6B0RTZ1_9CETA|nr:hypothetical protein [Bos mutus]